MDWFLYDNGLRHERVKNIFISGVFRNMTKIYDAAFLGKLLTAFGR